MMNKEYYDNAFYKDIMNGSRTSAAVVVPYLLSLFPHVNRVADFGCGAGMWLKEFELAGKEVHGYDFGIGVPDNLAIPATCFTPADLGAPLVVEKRFDLALCLETAEHVPAGNAAAFIASLTNSADIIVFSAAIPGQGGTGHCNEQWQSYWVTRFEEKGFQCHDCLRPVFWHDTRISFWYRQNMFLCLKRASPQVTPPPPEFPARSFHHYPLVHPELFFLFHSAITRAENN